VLPVLLLRFQVVLAALWLGLVLILALMVAPMLFAMLDRPLAGQVAGALFRVEAHAALGVAVALFLIERRQANMRAVWGRSSRFSIELGLILAALFCTILGYFGLQPMMDEARAGQGSFSFGLLHGVSSAFFAVKGLILSALTWRLITRLGRRG
jgi:hypothetical protein